MLPSFPHLTDSEFNKACEHLLHRFQLHGDKQEAWTTVEIVHQPETQYLRITKPLQTSSNPSNPNHDQSDPHNDSSTTSSSSSSSSMQDFDPETLLPPNPLSPDIHYTIHLSPTYRVPVLYIHIQDPLHRFPPTMATLSSHIIPAHYKAQTEHVGVMGGITVTHHPCTDRPVFFIHPCRTAEVMEASVGKEEVLSAGEYLMVWIGALGGSVGLDVPVGLVSGDLSTVDADAVHIPTKTPST